LFLNKFVPLSVILVVLLVVSVFSLTHSGARCDEDYIMDCELVFAYFKTFDVSNNTNVFSSNKLVSYVFVLNVTNPNNKTILLDNLLIAFHDFAVKSNNSVSGTTTIIRYFDSFGSNVLDYQLPPRFSKLMAFTGVGELSSLELMGLKNGTIFSSMTLNGNVEENIHTGTGLIFQEMSFDVLSESEWMYNSAFYNDRTFSFRNDDTKVSYES